MEKKDYVLRYHLVVNTSELYSNEEFARKRYNDLLKRIRSENSIIRSMKLVDLESGVILNEY